MANPFVHIELTTPDVKASKAFYGSLLDWTLEDVDMGGGNTYTMIKVGEGTGGGMYQMKDAPPMWVAYVAVDDVKASTAKAKTLGASVMKDVTEVMGMGWFSIIADPQGAIFALWQMKPKT